MVRQTRPESVRAEIAGSAAAAAAAAKSSVPFSLLPYLGGLSARDAAGFYPGCNL